MSNPTSAEFAASFPQLAHDLGQENLQVVLRAASSLALPAGRRVIRDRGPVDAIYFLLDGTVAVSVEEDGHSVAVGTAGPGEMLGEVSVLSGELLASSTVTASTSVRLLRLKHQAFEDLINTNADIAAALLKHLVGMLAARLRSSQSVAAAPIRIDEAAPDQTLIGAKPPRNWLAAFFGKE